MFTPKVVVNRRSTPAVIQGRVQKKNGFRSDRGYSEGWRSGVEYQFGENRVWLDRQRPGVGYRHLLTIQNLREFLPLIPDWEELSQGLNAVVLAPGEQNTNGWYQNGIVAICAWERDLWHVICRSHYEEHRTILKRLGVPCIAEGKDNVRCEWTIETARAYQLLHILPHELGHHQDRMKTKSKRCSARGEPYAETFAVTQEPLLWERYWRKIGA